MATTEQWLAKIAKLKIDRAKGPAPHKPVLLLVLLDLAEQGLLPDTTVPLTPELAFPFYSYWSIVAHRRRQRPDVRLPFHHPGATKGQEPTSCGHPRNGPRHCSRTGLMNPPRVGTSISLHPLARAGLSRRLPRRIRPSSLPQQARGRDGSRAGCGSGGWS
jgi:hypothetical protein